jgi:beta-glucosidase
LSYTSFAYSDLRLSSASMAPEGKIVLSFTLANSGPVAGAEVVQLYLRDPVASVVRPLKELKGFQRVVLQPGQKQTISFTIDRETLAFYNRKLAWGVEAGKFEVMVGSASDDVRLRQTIELTSP